MDLMLFALLAAGSAVGISAYLAKKRQWLALGAMGPAAPNSRNNSSCLVYRGVFVRGLDMNRVTSSGVSTPHWGVDVGAPTGTPVYAVKPGTVVGVGWINGYGNTVQISHGSQSTMYAHLNATHARAGMQVDACQHVGDVGATGIEGMGPHLHFEVHPASRPVLNSSFQRLDPQVWLQQQGTALYAERWNPRASDEEYAK